MGSPRTTQLIVLNGGSSAGTSSISRCLQTVLVERPWLRLGVDDLVDRLPESLLDEGSGITFGERGGVAVGAGFRDVEAAWLAGVAAMARAGAGIVYDDVFLEGGASQRRLRAQLDGVGVLWVGVRCAPATAAAREAARGDRSAGMAALQAEVVHEGVDYDVEVDTTHTGSQACARTIAAHVVRA